MERKTRRQEHAADTRSALIKAARRRFARLGYAATSLDDVCDQARVTKGALYHHFGNKEELFTAVLEQVESDFITAGADAVDPGANLVAALQAAGRAFLTVCARTDTRHIVIEAPAVLGWARCREIEDGYAAGLLRTALDRARKNGAIEARNPDVLAQLLVGLFNEAGMMVAAAGDGDATRTAVVAELDRLIAGIALPTHAPA